MDNYLQQVLFSTLVKRLNKDKIRYSFYKLKSRDNLLLQMLALKINNHKAKQSPSVIIIIVIIIMIIIITIIIITIIIIIRRRIVIIIIVFFKLSCFMYFQMKLHYNQTFYKILTQQKFSIYYIICIIYLSFIRYSIRLLQFLFLQDYLMYEYLMATSWSLPIKYFSLMIMDFKKFLNVFTFLVAKPREVTSRNINRKFDGGVSSSLLIPLYLVSLYSRDFVVLFS